MALSEAQIERFSRQIILRQIGATGQQRLLEAAVAVAGSGAVATTAALYLAGAGIGRIDLQGGERAALGSAIAALAPDTRVTVSDHAVPLHGGVTVLCDLPLADLDRLASAARPLVAGGAVGARGWLVVADGAGTCVRCAARNARPPAERGREGLESVAAGVIGSLLALEVLALLLGLRPPRRGVWTRFDARAATLDEIPIERAPDCPLCATA